MKQCIICKKQKQLEDYYKHPQMSDGHLNKCKLCCKNQAKKRDKELRKNPDWCEKEKERGREKYYRLGYKSKTNSQATQKHLNKFPEKRRAKNKSTRLRKEGFEKHHWNYSEGFEKDVIWMTKKDHCKLHRYLIYDKIKFIYNTMDGNALNTKEKHLKYWLIINKI